MHKVVVKKITVKTPIIELDNEFSFVNTDNKTTEPISPAPQLPVKGLQLVAETQVQNLSTIILDDIVPPNQQGGRVFSMLQTNSFVQQTPHTRTPKIFKKRKSTSKNSKLPQSYVFDLEAAVQMPSHQSIVGNSPTVSSYMRRQKLLSERLTQKLKRFKSVQSLPRKSNLSQRYGKGTVNPRIERRENGTYGYTDPCYKRKEFKDRLRSRLQTPARAKSAHKSTEFSPARRTCGNFYFPKKEKLC